MDLSILIVNWNTRDLLAQCLESIYANRPNVECEVIVVDNGSSDYSAENVRKQFPQVHVIENSVNTGFVHANNQAISVSTGRYVMLLNSDTIVQRGALGRMVEFMDSHPDAGIVGSYVLNLDGTPQWCFGCFPSIFSETFFAWGLDSRAPFSKWFAPRLGFSDEYRQVDWVLGATLMIRRQVLGKVGLLDEAFSMYSEEIDLCYRVMRAGWKNYVLGTARIIHLGQQSSRQIPAPMKAELFRSKTKYFRKHQGLVMAALMNAIFAASILGRYCFYRLQGQMQVSALWKEAWEYFSNPKRPRGFAPIEPQVVVK